MHHRLAVLAVLLCGAVAVTAVAEDKPKPQLPGPTDKGFLLPNGWTLTPAGKHVVLTDLPLNILPLADDKHALVATSGYNKHELSLVDLTKQEVVDRQAVRQSWFGLATTPAQDRVWWSGGGADQLHTFDLKDGKLSRTSDETAGHRPGEKDFKSGISPRCEEGLLYSLDINKATLAVIGLKEGRTIKTAELEGRPYDLVLSRNGAQLYVSDWAGRQVLVVDTDSLKIVARIPVGEHPNQMVLHPKDDRLFVACASSNTVAVIDTKRGIVTETIRTSLFPRAPKAARRMPSPSRRTARRCSSPTPTTTASPSSILMRRTRARSRASFPPAGIRPPSPSRPTARTCSSASARG